MAFLFIEDILNKIFGKKQNKVRTEATVNVRHSNMFESGIGNIDSALENATMIHNGTGDNKYNIKNVDCFINKSEIGNSKYNIQNSVIGAVGDNVISSSSYTKGGKTMNVINVNGKRIEVEGNNVVISGGSIIVDGVTVTGDMSEHAENGVVKIQWEGELANVRSDRSIECGDVHGNVNAGSSVTCKGVGNDVDAGSSITCDAVQGSASAGSSVRCGDVGKNVKAGSSVRCGNVNGNVSAMKVSRN